jgi:hypothetical protein
MSSTPVALRFGKCAVRIDFVEKSLLELVASGASSIFRIVSGVADVSSYPSAQSALSG